MAVNANFGSIYELTILEFKSNLGVLAIEYEGCLDGISYLKSEIEKRGERPSLVKLLGEYEAEKQKYEAEFESYKARYAELLRDVSGVISEMKLVDVATAK